jgi:deoxyribose-phosphate aldolase
MITPQNIAPYLDLANHHPESTEQDVKNLCQKVLQYGFNSAFMNAFWVKMAKEYMAGAGKVGTVVSFPLGQDTIDSKIFLTLNCQKDGADELDVSTNVGLLKMAKDQAYLEEMKKIVTAVKEKNQLTIVKFIIETGLLTDDEIKKAALLVLQSGADFIKTNSGMGPRGARLTDLPLIKNAVGDKIKIKVAGGITTLQQVQEFIAAGATRIGTSKAVEIITQVSF